MLDVQHSDPDTQRRGQNLIIIAIGLIILNIFSVPLVLIQPEPLPQLAPVVVAIAGCSGFIVLARRGAVALAGYLLLGLIILALFLTPLGSGQIGLVPCLFLLAGLIAGVIARPRDVMLATLACFVAIGVQFALVSPLPQRAPDPIEVAIFGGLLVAIVGLIGGLGARSTQQALQAAQAAQAQAEAAAQALDAINRELEARVAERTQALAAALVETEQRANEQAALLAEIDRQQAAIRALSAPLLPVANDTLVLPLVGDFDAERIADLGQHVLPTLERTRARRLLIDVTGVPVIDAQVAQGLVAVVDAARLLGTRTTLIGVSPEVAQALVALGIDLQRLRTVRDLQSALS
jgi:rsbT co-antagonist protein RsbR